MPILYLAIALLALASALVKWLILNGGELGLKEPGAISFCNVLFVGNLLGGIVAWFSFGPRASVADLKKATRPTWVHLILNILFAVAIPSLLFTALETTTVTNLVLIGRFESVFFACFAGFLGVSAIGRLQTFGYGFIAVGVVALVLIQGMGSLQTGDYLVIAAAFLQAVAALSVKKLLTGLRWGTFVFVRNFVSAIVFFGIAIYFFGFEHFADAFVGELWLVMLVYSVVIVVIGQAAWYYSLEKRTAEQVASATLLTPFLAVGFAYLLLGEVPGVAHWVGGSVIAIGMVLVQRGRPKAEAKTPASCSACAESSLAGA